MSSFGDENRNSTQPPQSSHSIVSYTVNSHKLPFPVLFLTVLSYIATATSTSESSTSLLLLSLTFAHFTY